MNGLSSIFEKNKNFINQEPYGNKFKIVEPFCQNLFPYCMIGKLNIIFINEYNSKVMIESVGTLIGPNIVLTTAHSLLYIDKNYKVLKPNKIFFLPNINGKFSPIQTAEFYSYYISENFFQNLEHLSINDYAIILLNRSVGDEIIKLYDLEQLEELSITYEKGSQKYNFYNFFSRAEENLDKISNNIFLSKISLISYTRYKEEYLKSYSFPYSLSFKKINNKIRKENQRQIKFKSANENIEENSTKPNEKNDTQRTFIQFKINAEDKLLSDHIINQEDNFELGDEVETKSNSIYKKIISYNKEKQKNMDIIIFDEKFPIQFYTELSNVLCEAKGYICNNINNKNFDNHNQVINFRLSTFSDQNGSPIFLLLKEKKSMNKTSSGKYRFYFIGIHCHSKKLRVSSTKMNECKYKECLTNDNLGLKINSGILMDLNNNIIKLKNILMKNFSPSINNLRPEGLSVKNKDYYPLIIKFSQKIVLQGAIKKNSYLVEIFLAAERIFGKIPIRFISLLYVGQIINFDMFAFKDISELKEIFKNPNYTNSIFNFIEFEILLNFSEYGKILAEKFLKNLNQIQEY